MTSRDFCYWLQGFFEIQGANTPPLEGGMGLTGPQVAMIKAHLHMVFKHEIDPSMGSPEHQEELKKLHEKVEKRETRVAVDLRATEVPKWPSHFDPNPKFTC